MWSYLSFHNAQVLGSMRLGIKVSSGVKMLYVELEITQQSIS
jgi:hypothetical protein